MRSTLPAPPPPSVGFLSGDPSAPAFLCQPLQGGLGWVPQISNALVGSWVYPDSPVHLCRVGQFLATLVWKCHLHLLQASALHMTGGPTSSATLLSSFPLSLSHFPHPDTAFSAPLSLLFCTPTLQCLPSLPFSEPLPPSLPLSTSGSFQWSSGTKHKQTQAADSNHFPWQLQGSSCLEPELLGREGHVPISWLTLIIHGFLPTCLTPASRGLMQRSS